MSYTLYTLNGAKRFIRGKVSREFLFKCYSARRQAAVEHYGFLDFLPDTLVWRSSTGTFKSGFHLKYTGADPIYYNNL